MDPGASAGSARTARSAGRRRWSDRPIRVVLDASAIIAYTRESINVGEILAEVDDEAAAFGLPVLCLVEASRIAVDEPRFELLLTHPACAILPVDADDWQALAATNWIVGRIDAASAALAAIDNDCYALTGQPGVYGGLVDGGPIIGV